MSGSPAYRVLASSLAVQHARFSAWRNSRLRWVRHTAPTRTSTCAHASTPQIRWVLPGRACERAAAVAQCRRRTRCTRGLEAVVRAGPQT